MSRLLVCIVTATLLSVASQAALAQEAHEKPDPEPGTSHVDHVEVEAGDLYSPYDLASSGLSAKDLVRVSNFVSSGKIDRPSLNDN